MIVAPLTIDFGFQIDSYRNVTFSVFNPFLAINFSSGTQEILPVYGKRKSPKSDKPGFSQKNQVFQKNSVGDFRVRKIGRSKLHSVLPMNENEFRFSEVSYHLKKPSF